MFDFNRCIALAALVIIVVVAAQTNYRLEIGATGLKFEPNNAQQAGPLDAQKQTPLRHTPYADVPR